MYDYGLGIFPVHFYREWTKLPVLTSRVYLYFHTMIFNIYWTLNCQDWMHLFLLAHLIYSLGGPVWVTCYLHLIDDEWVLECHEPSLHGCSRDDIGMKFPVRYRTIKGGKRNIDGMPLTFYQNLKREKHLGIPTALRFWCCSDCLCGCWLDLESVTACSIK